MSDMAILSATWMRTVGLLLGKRNIPWHNAMFARARRAEIALRQGERRWSTAQRQAQIALWVWDGDRDEHIDVSAEIASLYGVPIGHVPRTAADFLSFVHPADRERVAALYRDLERSPRDYEIEYHVVCGDGSVRYFHEIGEIDHEAATRSPSYTGTMQDITARRQLQEEMHQALEQANSANHTKTAFLANMSHELRTPLNAIIGFSELLTSEVFGPLPAKQADYLRDIHSSGQHLLKLVNDILDLAKVEAGRLELALDPMEIGEVVGECIRLLRDRAEERKQRLRVALAPDLPTLRADRLRIKQVLLNLVSNAIKFTPQAGEVTIAVARNGDGIRIQITDTGIGMRREDIDLALQPFCQIDTSLARKYEGAGLGLPLAKTMIDLHGGRLGIDSKPGIGTTVEVWLPIGTGDDVERSRLEAVSQNQQLGFVAPRASQYPVTGLSDKRGCHGGHRRLARCPQH